MVTPLMVLCMLLINGTTLKSIEYIMTTNRPTLRRRCLILVAHGSRRSESNEEIEMLVQKLGLALQNEYDKISHAFLEIAQPSVPQAIDAAVQNTFNKITVLPYFLAAGTHVVKDIPVIVDEKREQHPNIDIRLTPYLGSDERVVEILAALSREVESN
ncbi:MAG: CbiX/SirB N-terminal domain-containing protein [Gammaproteobacteria bacterium]|nr:CbiX/SirB N-terminal domain-containing protein [Gammaproteobacteria bacterium]